MPSFVEEHWNGPSNRVGYPLLVTAPPQTYTTYWIDAANEDSPFGARSANLDSMFASILLDSAPTGTRWPCKGAMPGTLPGDSNQTHEETIPGARTLGFYVCSFNANIQVSVDVVGWDPRGALQSESITLTGRTHTHHSGFSSWLSSYNNNQSMIPQAATFYNPNGLTLVTTPPAPQDVKWARIPVVDSFQTTKAWSRLRYIELTGKSNTTANDVLVPHFKVLAISPRTVITGLGDIVSGVVFPDPSLPDGTLIPQPHPAPIGFALHYSAPTGVTGWAPMVPLPTALKKANMSYSPTNNIIRFTTATATGTDGINPYVYGAGGRLTPLVAIDMRGDLLLGHVDFWLLRLVLKGTIEA